MAKMIPQYPITSNEAVIDFYQNLHYQLGPDYRISQHLDTACSLQGTMLWVEYKLQSLFIYISELSEYELKIDKTNKKLLQKQILESKEINKIIDYKKQLLPDIFQSFHAQLTPFVIIHSKITEEKLNIKSKPLGLTLLGKEVLESDDLKSVLHRFMGNDYSREIQKHIKKIFNSEILVLVEDKRFLLDQDQETAIKTEIVLNEDNRQQANCNLCGVNGGSDSGKSEVILQRAKLLSMLNPSQKVLILAVNETSKEPLLKRFMRLMPSPVNENIQLLSYHEWCEQGLSLDQKLTHEYNILGTITDTVRENLDESKTSLLIFQREMNFIQGRAIKTEADYLKARKASQLSKEQHSDVWNTLQALNAKMQSKNTSMYSELPRQLWEAALNGQVMRQYDHILVDDAHYFPPLAFELMKKSLVEKKGQLFISQDPRQGIVNPISLWKDTGLDLRGKSTRLLNNYQSNPYILNAANAFYMNRLPDDTDKVIQFNFANDKNFKKPQLLHFNSVRDEENRLLNEIRVLIQEDVELKDILLLTYDTRTYKHLGKLIQHTLDIKTTSVCYSLKEQQNGLRLCTIDQPQGLKSPYVFIFGLEDLFEKNNELEEISNIDTDDYHQSIYIENTRKLNKAMTVAKKELTLFVSADDIPDELVSPHIRIPTTDNDLLAEVHQLKA